MFENAFNNIDKTLRAEQGVSSELDYAEQTSWVLFLKYLDDLETQRADKAELEDLEYTPILAEEYQWRVWAAPRKNRALDHNNALTGDDLVKFVNNELFPYF